MLPNGIALVCTIDSALVCVCVCVCVCVSVCVCVHNILWFSAFRMYYNIDCSMLVLCTICLQRGVRW